MKLHEEATYYKLPFILKSGSIPSRVKYNLRLKGEGFNRRNRKKPELPVDQDNVREYFKRSSAEKRVIKNTTISRIDTTVSADTSFAFIPDRSREHSAKAGKTQIILSAGASSTSFRSEKIL